MSHEQDFSRLKNVCVILDKIKINYWIDHGTLLGFVRDSNFINWDRDIDLSIKGEIIEEFDRLISEIKRIPDSVILVTNRGIKIMSKNLRTIDISYYAYNQTFFWKVLKSFPSKDLKFKYYCYTFLHVIYFRCLNFYINRAHSRKKSFMLTNISKLKFLRDLFAKDLYSRVPNFFFDEFVNLNVDGFNFNVPKNPINYLTYRYGSDWGSPKIMWSIGENDDTIDQNK